MNSSFRTAFQQRLQSFVENAVDHTDARDACVRDLIKRTSAFALSPGKRIRPLLAYEAAKSVKAQQHAAYQVGIALELFHDFALVHDDIIDQSELRRGRPALHVAFQNMHHKKQLRGDGEQFGENYALLSGDLLLTWSDAAIRELNIKRRDRIEKLWDEMKSEVILGQALDVSLGASIRRPSRKKIMYMLAVKSGRYSIARPMLLGYALGSQKVDANLVIKVAEPLGIAFQVQDDLLGMFGHPDETGKSRDADLREGKVTLLAFETIKRLATDRMRKEWDHAWGNPLATKRQLDHARQLVEESGAKQYVETLSAQLIELSIDRSDALPGDPKWFQNFALWLQGRTS